MKYFNIEIDDALDTMFAIQNSNNLDEATNNVK